MRISATLMIILNMGCTGDEHPPGCAPDPLECEDLQPTHLCPVQCDDPAWMVSSCESGEGGRQEPAGNAHIAQPAVIEYSSNPPASGDHRPMWACWGEYEYLSPTRWLHNLEHGGVAFLYHPCAPTELIENLREYARKYQTGDNEDFRWVMTPYPHLPSAIGVVTWGWVYSAQCIRPSEIDAFIAQHYRKAAEDIAVDGTYSKGYLGR